MGPLPPWMSGWGRKSEFVWFADRGKAMDWERNLRSFGHFGLEEV
jgi:hypothetical protein